MVNLGSNIFYKFNRSFNSAHGLSSMQQHQHQSNDFASSRPQPFNNSQTPPLTSGSSTAKHLSGNSGGHVNSKGSTYHNRFSPSYSGGSLAVKLENSSSSSLTSPNQPKITSSSDPKAIAAMLNEKYGYKKPAHADQPVDTKECVKKQSSESSLPENSKSSSSYSGSTQPYSSKRDRQDKRSSYRDTDGGRHYSKSPKGHHHHQRASSPGQRDSGGFRRQISTPPSVGTSNNPTNFNMAASLPNFSASMINSPAFMATMTSMLSNMAQQGVNVNAILNQMPNLLASFDQKNLNPGGFNQFSPSDGRENRNKNSKNNNRNYFPKRGANNGGELLIDDPLLPNPTGFAATSGSNPAAAAAADSSFPNFSKAFYSYLSSFAQTMGVNSNNPGMMHDSAAQFNSMLNESGLEANFNEFYSNANRWDHQSAGYSGMPNQGAYGDNRYYGGNGGHHDNNYLPGDPYYDNYDNYNQSFNPPPNYNNAYSHNNNNNNNHKNNKGHNFNNKYNNNNKRKRH